MELIPTKIHQMWLDRNDINMTGLPPNYPIYKTYSDTWKQMHPDFEYKLWNNRDVEELWKHPKLEKYKEFYENTLGRQIEKCDFARYAVMAVHGGVYVDLDFICKRNIASLLKNREIGLAKDVAEHSQVVGDMIFNGFLVSKPLHPFWFSLLDTIMEKYNPQQNVLWNTGPKLIASIYKFTPENELPSCLLIPINGAQQISIGCKKEDFENAYCYTKWYEGSFWYLEGVREMIKTLGLAWPLLILFIIVILIVFLSRRY